LRAACTSSSQSLRKHGAQLSVTGNLAWWLADHARTLDLPISVCVRTLLYLAAARGKIGSRSRHPVIGLSMAITQLKASAGPAGGDVRIFIAICPPQAIRVAITRYQGTWIWNRSAALVSQTKFHLTLYFIGLVERQSLQEIKRALKTPFTAFELNLDTPELWEEGIAVLRPSNVPDELLSLQDALTERIHMLGLRVEKRDLKIHLTLARHAQAAKWPKQKHHVKWSVHEYALLESRRNSSVSYKTLQKYSSVG
jgi:2'-5' RNA ligase